jgi:integrase
LRLHDSKEGASIRPLGLAALDLLDSLRTDKRRGFVFEGTVEGKPFIGFPKHWERVFEDSALADITPHVLRHSFASIANDLGFTESTIAALLGHARGTITSRYIHALDTALIMAADTVSGYIQALMDGASFERPSYALDRASRERAVAKRLGAVKGREVV